MDLYFNELDGKIKSAYEIAEKARSLGLDPSLRVEALPAGDLASRVEGLDGPEGEEREKEAPEIRVPEDLGDDPPGRVQAVRQGAHLRVV